MGCALAFDRGSGFLALITSAGLLASLLPRQGNANVHIAALASFLLVGALLVLIGEGLHRALERAYHAEREKDLLLEEMSHRVKNVITLIDSMATQTLTSSASLDEFGNAFHGRLRAIARAHGELFSNQWRAADIRSLVLATLEGCATDKSRVELNGEPLSLSPYQAMAVNLTLHELCTNAVKYGALSRQTGQVNVTWAVKDGMVALRWQESGGPAVALPTRKSLGSPLIEVALPLHHPAEAREVLSPVLEALMYLHRENFVHGRLQPSNVFAVEDEVKLSTYGVVAFTAAST